MKKMILILMLVVFNFYLISKEKEVKLNISGMCCKDCSSKIETKLKEVNGVQKADVDFKSGVATITYNEQKNVSEDKLIAAVGSAGKNFKASNNTTKKEKHDECDDEKGSDKDCADKKDCKEEVKKDCCKKDKVKN